MPTLDRVRPTGSFKAMVRIAQAMCRCASNTLAWVWCEMHATGRQTQAKKEATWFKIIVAMILVPGGTMTPWCTLKTNADEIDDVSVTKRRTHGQD